MAQVALGQTAEAADVEFWLKDKQYRVIEPHITFRIGAHESPRTVEQRVGDKASTRKRVSSCCPPATLYRHQTCCPCSAVQAAAPVAVARCVGVESGVQCALSSLLGVHV